MVLGEFLRNLRTIEHPRLYWGFLDGRARPRRKGQWAEKDWVLCDRYLPYQVSGLFGFFFLFLFVAE